MPTITVVTPARNAAEYIGETIESIRAQTHADWEHLIVDDASEDGTAFEIAKAARVDSRIRLIRRDEPGGPFLAANQGISEAHGKFVSFIDADDIAPPKRFERQLATLAERGARATISNWRWFSDPAHLGDCSELPSRPNVVRWYLGIRAFASNSSLTIEREALTEVGGYGEREAVQDYALVCTLSRRDWLAVSPDVLSFVRSHPGQRSVAPLLRVPRHTIGIEVMTEHLRSISPIPWEEAQVRTLFMAVHQPRETDFRIGRTAVERWQQAWREDGTLNDQDRADLSVLAARHLRILAGASVRRNPLKAAAQGVLPFLRRVSGTVA